jgi:hypothetical protein
VGREPCYLEIARFASRIQTLTGLAPFINDATETLTSDPAVVVGLGPDLDNKSDLEFTRLLIGVKLRAASSNNVMMSLDFTAFDINSSGPLKKTTSYLQTPQYARQRDYRRPDAQRQRRR